jgi:GR25 family glycosyltransferase involved in LPS biosynthesis
MLELTGLNKLEGFGPVYVINMEKSLDRKNYIDEHFKKYGISDYTFIKAVDGSVEDLSNLTLCQLQKERLHVVFHTSKL